MTDFDDLKERSELAERYLKLFANKHRLLVLCALLDSELSVGELNEQIPLAQSALSQHLAKLREQGLVQARKQQQTVYYRVADQRALKLLMALHEIFCE